MAVRVFARLSVPLTQSLKRSPNLRITQPSKSTPLFIDSRFCRASRGSLTGDEAAVKCEEKDNVAVVFPDGVSQLMTLARAGRIAAKRNCELVGVRDEADFRVVYRLVPLGSGGQGQRDEGEKKEKAKKQPKGIDITTTTTERDLLVKCKKIVKMLQSNHSVRVRLHNAEQMNKTTSTSEQEIRDILQSTIQELGTMREETKSNKRTVLLIEPNVKDTQEGSSSVPLEKIVEQE